MKKKLVKLNNLDSLQEKVNIPIKKNELKKQIQNNNHINKWKKKLYLPNKINYNGNKQFLKNRKKDKNKIRQEMPDSPHNTGQYLTHIHQELSKKNKSTSSSKDTGDLIGNEIISCFEDEDNSDDFGDLNLDFQFIEDKKRDQLMSMEGKDIHNFLFNHIEKEKEKEEAGDNQNMNDKAKIGINFNEIKEDNPKSI